MLKSDIERIMVISGLPTQNGFSESLLPRAHLIQVLFIVHHRRRVRFLSTIGLVDALDQEKHDGKPVRLAI